MQYQGTVKWFDPNKNFGFISGGPEGDVFVHARNLARGRDELIEGQEVSFQLRPSARGNEACEVEVTRESEQAPRPRMSRPPLPRRFGGPAGSGRPPAAAPQLNRPAAAPQSNRPPAATQSNLPAAALQSNRRAGLPYLHPSVDLPSESILCTVVSRDRDDRFMFVKADVEGFDVFVHGSLYRDAYSDLRRGDSVRVTVEQSDRGLRATSLQAL